jgi:ribosome maturation factor RimP
MTEKELQNLIEPLVNSLGFSLWGLKLATGKQRGVLKVYIEAEDGVTVDQCAEVSRNLSVMLDVEDPIPGRYSLEVSSPGIEREFFQVDQMRPYVGEELTVHLKDPVEGRKNFAGTLTNVAATEFEIQEPEGECLTFTWDKVKQTRLRYRFPEPGNGKPGSKSRGGK